MAWLIPSWIVFELVMTKLPHYTMPMYPALALLSGRAVFAAAGGMRQMRRPLWRGLAWMWFGASAVPVLLTWASAGFLLFTRLRYWDSEHASLAYSQAGALLAACLVVPVIMYLAARRWPVVMGRDLFVGAQLIAVLFMPPLSLVLLQGAAPLCMTLSPRIADMIARISYPGPERPAAILGYHEDSLVFETRGLIARVGDEDVGEWLDAHPNGLLFQSAIRRSPPWDVREIGTVDGSNVPAGYFMVSLRVWELRK